MAQTNQRSIPLALFVVALALVVARVVVAIADKPEKGDLVAWVPLEQAHRIAASTNKPILYDFTADWCAPCHELDAEVFRNPALASEINERFVPVRVVDRQREEGRNSPEVAALQERYGVRGFPTVVFAGAGGRVHARMEGFPGRAAFERVMGNVR